MPKNRPATPLVSGPSKGLARLSVLTGRAGSGKTHRCLELFCGKLRSSERSGLDEPSYYILPSSEHAERIQSMLFRDPALNGLLGQHILTIRDFIQLKARESSLRRISHFDRSQLVAEILSEGGWSWLEAARKTRGLPYLLADFLREMKRSGMGTAGFAAASRKLAAQDAYFGAKRGDLLRLLEAYDRLCAERGLVDPEEETLAFASEARAGRGGALGLVIFDGFFGFTEAQLRFIEAVAVQAERVVVTLTRDAAPRRAVFDYPDKVLARLARAGFADVRVGAEGGEPPRFVSGDLRRLERYLFAAEVPDQAGGAPVDVRILEAAGDRQEIEMAAREILALTRDAGRFWSDVMVVMRTIGDRRALVEEVFGEYGIPCEVHERKRLSENPLMRFLSAWMELFTPGDAALGVDPARAAALARSDRFLFKPSAADAIEAALSPAPLPAQTLERLASASLSGDAGRFAAWLQEEVRAYAALRTAADARAFFECLMGAPPEASARAADEEAARKAFFELLDAAALGVLSFNAGRFNERLRSAVEAGLYSTPSADKNRVQVYDVSLALQKEYRFVFVLGLSQGIFPRATPEDPVLKDSERMFLNSAGAAFDTRAARASGERYYFYMAATRAREKLYFARVRQDDKGRAIEPSPFLAEAAKCFGEAIPVIRGHASEVVPPAELVATPLECVHRFCLDFEEPESAALGRSMRQSSGIRTLIGAEDPAEFLLPLLFRRDPPNVLRDTAIRAHLAPAGRATSATRLETAANCLYQHFAAYVLDLKDSRPPSEALQNGRILHQVLESGYRKLFAGRRRIPSAAEIEAALAAVLDKAFDDPQHAVPLEKPFRALQRRKRLRQALRNIAAREAEHFARYPGYVPEYFEWSFGGPEGTRHLELEAAGQKILVRGTIDRIDVNREARKALAIDYKLSAVPSHKALRSGSDLQGPLYVLAVRSLLGLDAAGIEFASFTSAKRGRLVKNSCGVGRMPANRGWVDEADFEDALERAKKRAADIVAKAGKGEIPAEPADAEECKRCHYKSLCRIEAGRIRR